MTNCNNKITKIDRRRNYYYTCRHQKMAIFELETLIENACGFDACQF